MLSRLAVAKRVILLKRMLDTLPLLPVVAAAPRLHRSGSHDPGDGKTRRGAARQVCRICVDLRNRSMRRRQLTRVFARFQEAVQDEVQSAQNLGRPTAGPSPSMTAHRMSGSMTVQVGSSAQSQASEQNAASGWPLEL